MAERAAACSKKTGAALKVCSLVAVALLLGGVGAGCGEATTSGTLGAAVSGAVQPDDVYASLADAVRPMPVFAPTALPAGAVLAESWAPVLDSDDPAAYGGPERSNPYVAGSGPDAEIQVVYSVGTGWLVVIENFHGDLGDVNGDEVGSAAGCPAALFAVNGGELVQWSKDGRWYGVFGRGVSRADILTAALGMAVEPAESS